MKRVVLDTSIIIDFLRQRDKSGTLLVHFAEHKYDLYVSIVTHAECFAGKSVWERQDARAALETLFSNIRFLPVSEAISKKAGEISARYGLNIIDAIIASTAIVQNMQLATLNVKDFDGVAGIKLFEAGL